MLNATITGQLTGGLRENERGAMFCTVYSAESKRAVRAVLRSQEHIDLIATLSKMSRLTVTGPLMTKGAVSPSGHTLALLSINVQSMKIHHTEATQ